MDSKTNLTEYLSLKWGTLKGWDLHTQASMEALQRYFDAGPTSGSAINQHDNHAQKQALCALIDVLDNDGVYLDWDGKIVNKVDAKTYVMGYGKAKTPAPADNPPAEAGA